MSLSTDTNSTAPGLSGVTTATSSSQRWTTVENLRAPAAPESIADTGVEAPILRDLALKLAQTTPQFTTEWAANYLCLPIQLVEELCHQLKQDHLLEVLGQEGPFNYRYSATQRGREYANRLFDVSGYLGPAPVSVDAYAELLDQQSVRREGIGFERVKEAVSELVLPPESVEVAALAVASGRSLFLFGPSGNGKTSLGRMLHRVFQGDVWIPHCINVDSNIIRIFDERFHDRLQPAPTGRIDARWVRIRRPFVVAGGEMTIEELDLAYSPSLRFYEAPPHVKANGGTFLIDDLGRQRVDPHELLNRWIIPLEHQTDHLTLRTGQKIQIPFRLMLIVATNLTVTDVADPAFLRRMGYRLHVDKPTPENYKRIFQRYAESNGIHPSDELIEELIARYGDEGRELRASEPRDLVERAKDICALRGCEPQITREVLNTAWMAYFSDSQ